MADLHARWLAFVSTYMLSKGKRRWVLGYPAGDGMFTLSIGPDATPDDVGRCLTSIREKA